MTTSELLPPMNFPAWILCPLCKHMMTFEPDTIDRWLSDLDVRCDRCTGSVDAWSAVHAAIRDDLSVVGAFGLLGATLTSVHFELTRNQATRVEMPVPSGARILALALTPNGHLWPLEMTGNVLRRNAFPQVMSFFGAAVGSDPDTASAQTGRVMGMVAWLAASPAEFALEHLADAFAAFDARRFDRLIVPAAIAVECTITPAIKEALAFVGRDNELTSLLRGSVEVRFKLLADMIARLVGTSLLRKEAREQLDSLFTRRNQLAHAGQLKNNATLTQSEAAAMLAGALFGYRYGLLLQRAVADAKTTGKLPK